MAKIPWSFDVPVPPLPQLQALHALMTAYEFWMKDANMAGTPHGLLEPVSARQIALHALDEYWNLIEGYIK